ncbi:unnamed protein product, partial [Mesorhabditis belari]|uniref:Seven TM Receptor n=1 Tax=Mesorhabditis belari TaxID=2138241 RepID=A0AAF3EKK3_9BILA
MGNYKILMASFACFDIYFSIVQVITVPNFHIYRHCFVAFSLGPLLKGNRFESEYLGLTLYCCAYAMCLILLTYHFIYRYLLICNQHFMYLFNEKKYFLCWYIIWIFLAFLWGLAIRLSMYHWPQLVDYVRMELLKEYAVHVDQSGIMGPLYFLDGPNGTLKISWRAFVGSAFCVSLMGCCFSAILFCGLKVYLTLEKSSMSEKTKKLQWDLFKALLVQFSVPALCEFMPGGLNFICPIFAIPLGRWSNYSGIIASLNNIIEPICMLYFVKDYRYVLLKILRLKVTLIFRSEQMRNTLK